MIKFNFYTEKIDRTFYKQSIISIFSHWRIYSKDFNKWTINFYSTSSLKNNSDFYAHLIGLKTSYKMAWGYTGQKEMTFFLLDTNNYFSMLSNMVMISHEIGHAVGMIIFNKKPKIYVGEIHRIYYKFPRYETLEVFDKKIRILNLQDMMEKDRLCEIGWIFKKRIDLNAYAINYYNNKLFIKIVLLK